MFSEHPQCAGIVCAVTLSCAESYGHQQVRDVFLLVSEPWKGVLDWHAFESHRSLFFIKSFEIGTVCITRIIACKGIFVTI